MEKVKCKTCGEEVESEDYNDELGKCRECYEDEVYEKAERIRQGLLELGFRPSLTRPGELEYRTAAGTYYSAGFDDQVKWCLGWVVEWCEPDGYHDLDSLDSEEDLEWLARYIEEENEENEEDEDEEA